MKKKRSTMLERHIFGTSTEISNTISFGKVDYNGTGKKIQEITIDISLKRKKEGVTLSISGGIGNHCWGQCLDEMLPFLATNKLFLSVYRLWNLYHLNDIRAGCIHQRKAGWEEKRIDPKELPGGHSNRDDRGVLATWVNPNEHKDGLLTKPCPKCGYKYGSKWLFEEIPEDDIREAVRIIRQVD